MSTQGPDLLFSRLAERIYVSESERDVYQAVVQAAVELITGCDHACLMLMNHRTFETVAATDDVAALVDELEREAGEGPCVDAIVSEAYQHDADLSNGSPWPALVEQLMTRTPVRGMIGYRLLLDGRKAGALNLFSDTPGAFTPAAADAGAVLASFASVALMTAKARKKADDLIAGMESNREIGKAVGLLMAAHRVPQEEAFQILVKTSQEMNIKLAAVARQVVDGQDAQFRRAGKGSGSSA